MYERLQCMSLFLKNILVRKCNNKHVTYKSQCIDYVLDTSEDPKMGVVIKITYRRGKIFIHLFNKKIFTRPS